MTNTTTSKLLITLPMALITLTVIICSALVLASENPRAGTILGAYPTVEYYLDDTGISEGHKLRVVTVSLPEPSAMIHGWLL